MFKERKDREVTDAAAALIWNVLVCCGEEDQSVYIHTLTYDLKVSIGIQRIR